MKLASPYFSNLRKFAENFVRANANKVPDDISVSSLTQESIKCLQEHGTLIFKLTEAKRVEPLAAKLFSDCRPLARLNSVAGGIESSSSMLSEGNLRVVVGNQSMSELIGDGSPIANVRQGTDQGMIDFYNIDNYYPEAARLKQLILERGLKELLESVAGKSLYLKSMNAYVNLGVTETRGFHVDAFGVTQMKAFVYLTDVEQLDDGPYCYVLGSHKDKSLQRVNHFASKSLGLKSTDLVFFDYEKAYPIFGKAGTLIVSDQSGAHRGFPQGLEGARALAVFNFFQSA